MKTLLILHFLKCKTKKIDRDALDGQEFKSTLNHYNFSPDNYEIVHVIKGYDSCSEQLNQDTFL